MDSSIKDLFELNDDKENFEVPGGWKRYDYSKAYMKALKLKQSIESLIGDSCFMDSRHSLKKVNYLVDIELPDSVLMNKDEEAKIRISHFGSMVTIIGNKKHDGLSIRDDFQDEILKLINSREYIRIPNESLWIKYPKSHIFQKRKFKNWGHRFFEQL